MGHDLREIGNVVLMFPRGKAQLWDFRPIKQDFSLFISDQK
jgi:hypothetical protein